MLLYVLRHGIAEPRRPGRADADRALTADGREKLRRVLKQARRSGVQPTVILSSPLTRARQTADLAAEVLGYKSEIIETEALSPKATPAQTWTFLRHYQGQPEILITGHEPHLSAFLAYALKSPNLIIDLKKGALAALQTDRRSTTPTSTLLWLLTPRTVR